MENRKIPTDDEIIALGLGIIFEAGIIDPVLFEITEEERDALAICLWYEINKGIVEKFNNRFPGCKFNTPDTQELVNDKNLLSRWKYFILSIEDAKSEVVNNMAMQN